MIVRFYGRFLMFVRCYFAKAFFYVLASFLLASCNGLTPHDQLIRVDLGGLGHLEKNVNLSNRQDAGTLVMSPGLSDLSAAPVIEQPGSVPDFEKIQDIGPKDYKIVGQDVVQLDYEQVELREIIEEIADSLGITIVVDSTISDKVTLRTAQERPLKHKDLWALLRLLSKDAGVLLEKVGAVYHARKDNSVLPSVFKLQGDPDSSGAPEVLQITPLMHVSLETSINILKPVVEPRGRLIAIPSLNILAIAAPPDLLKQINSLLALIDADPFAHRGLRLFRLKNAKAKELSAELDKILKLVAGDKSAFNILALERINALLVVTPPKRGFSDISRWVEILDQGGEVGNEQVFVYKVKNLSAKSLAFTLNSVFKRPNGSSVVPVNEVKGKVGSPHSGKDAGGGENKTDSVTVPSAASEKAAKSVSADLRVKIVADEDTNSLIIRATVRDYRQLLETIHVLDLAPLEVMVNTVIAEVTLTDDTRFGVEWSLLSASENSSVQNIFGLANELSSGLMNGLVVSGVDGHIDALLNFLGKNTNLKVLSRPSILVRNNQEATIKVGSEEPILTSITNSSTQVINGSTSLQNEVQYRDTGIILKVTPHINEDGIINLEILQEVSQVGENRTAFELPSFTNREIQTSAVVSDGSAIVLGGIIQSRFQKSLSGIPGLMDIPLFGMLFSDTTMKEQRTELVLIIIPEIIDPQDDNSNFVAGYLDRLDTIGVLLDAGAGK